MNPYNTDVIRIVLEAHGNQKYGDMPYIVHLMLVARHFTDPTKQAIALLHDILEDTDVTQEQLYDLFDEEIADTVIVLTRKPMEDYVTYIKRVKTNPLATAVKIADLEENLFVTEYSFSSERHSPVRYLQALKILKGEIV
jgi:(p)ppGpp synthase/HD superfamily hydrolase